MYFHFLNWGTFVCLDSNMTVDSIIYENICTKEQHVSSELLSADDWLVDSNNQVKIGENGGNSIIIIRYFITDLLWFFLGKVKVDLVLLGEEKFWKMIGNQQPKKNQQSFDLWKWLTHEEK